MGSSKRKMLMQVKHKTKKRHEQLCTTKIRYSFAEIQLYKEHYKQKSYKCLICEDWHLTSDRKQKGHRRQ
jgi:hypothetical protein